jgi:hypothetical protein
LYPVALSVHDCTVVPVLYAHGFDDAHVGVGPHSMPPLLLVVPLPLLLLLPLLPPQPADAESVTQTGLPAG